MSKRFRYSVVIPTKRLWSSFNLGGMDMLSPRILPRKTKFDSRVSNGILYSLPHDDYSAIYLSRLVLRPFLFWTRFRFVLFVFPATRFVVFAPRRKRVDLPTTVPTLIPDTIDCPVWKPNQQSIGTYVESY